MVDTLGIRGSNTYFLSFTKPFCSFDFCYPCHCLTSLFYQYYISSTCCNYQVLYPSNPYKKEKIFHVNTLIFVVFFCGIVLAPTKIVLVFGYFIFKITYAWLSFVILRADTSMEEGMLLATCILLTSKSVIDIALMTAVFSILISIGKNVLSQYLHTSYPSLSIYTRPCKQFTVCFLQLSEQNLFFFLPAG